MQQSIQDLCKSVLEQLALEGYTEKGIKKHSRSYRLFMNYAEQKGIFHYTEELGRVFVHERYGASFDSKRYCNSEYVTEKIRHLEKLWHYQQYGTIHFSNRSGKKKPFQCPLTFKLGYDAYVNNYLERELALASKRDLIYPITKFITFIDSSHITFYDDIVADTVSRFLSIYSDCSGWYMRTLTVKLRTFFGYLYENNHTVIDLRPLVPKIRIVRDAFIPSSWNKDDVIRLMQTIDRANPCGKRDYALLLLVIKLGLRSVDIHQLKLSNFDWKNKILHLIQHKTGELLNLPILDDVGWAVIDYLKYGRPKSDEEFLFIRHAPGGGPLSNKNTLCSILHKHMRTAGIKIPTDEHRGLHSLRSSLARNLLESGTPLPVISEIMGHRSTISTSHYLRINTASLNECAIDPEEVFSYE